MRVYKYISKEDGEIYSFLKTEKVEDLEDEFQIEIWDFEEAPKDFQRELAENERIIVFSAGYVYCNGVGWIKLTEKYDS